MCTREPFLALLHKQSIRKSELSCQVQGLFFYHQLLGTGGRVSFLDEFRFLHLSSARSMREERGSDENQNMHGWAESYLSRHLLVNCLLGVVL